MSRPPIRIALVGIGKIARDQHIPALANDPGFELVAAVSRHATVEEVPNFHDLRRLIASGLRVDAVSICTPPLGRHDIARAALDAGAGVMLEKPPGASVSEVIDLARRAKDRGATLFATWHSREAAAVEAARSWLADKAVRSVRIDWKEDIRVWHPGQDWILAAGGLGVFDPGINALSIATRILPEPLYLESARLETPANRGAPIAAALRLRHDHTPVAADFDFRQTGKQSWDITVETSAGDLLLSEGGGRLAIDGIDQPCGANEEYPRLYRRFADLVAAGASDVDLTPLQLVADAFLLAEQLRSEPFDF